MLHTVNKSPFEKNSLTSCLRLAAAGSDILLIEDGVYAAIENSEIANIVKGALDIHQVYVLEPDLRARGLDKMNLIQGIQKVDYAGFVSLAVENDSVHSWL